MYPVKYYRAYMKKYGVKGTSRFNKQQLNTKMLDVSEKNYQTRKTIKHDTTISLVLQLTKNENITNHIMSYVVNTTYYDTLKNIYSEQIMNDILLFCVSRYETMPERYRRNDDSYEKETMSYVHDKLFKKDPYYDEKGFFHAIVQLRLYYVKQHCLGNITTPFFIKVDSIHETMKRYNKKQTSYYRFIFS